MKLAEKLGLKLEDTPLTPPLIMYKMWRVMQRHLALAAARAGAELVPLDPRAPREAAGPTRGWPRMRGRDREPSPGNPDPIAPDFAPLP